MKRLAELCVTDFQSDIEDIARIASVPLILDVISRTTKMRFAAVARVTEDHWVCLASKDEIQFGLGPGGELEVQTTICDEIRRLQEPVVIDHVATDDVYCDHRTPALYGFQSYLSVPIFLRDGSFYGTLCAIDPEPADLKNSGAVDMFRLYAELIGTQLDTVRRAARAEAQLFDARATAELREQFIAVLGHDLRTPLGSFAAGLAHLRALVANEQATTVLSRMQRSSDRMARLVDDVLDFARARLGQGIELQRTAASLEPTLRHVVDELRSAHPDRVVTADFALTRSVNADHGRIAQLLSNLVSNALVHGAAGKPVRVRAATDENFELSVSNEGAPIPRDDLPRLFGPFARGAQHAERKGLGLGLYIAAEIARAHGGRLEADSSDGLTSFTFRMPL